MKAANLRESLSWLAGMAHLPPVRVSSAFLSSGTKFLGVGCLPHVGGEDNKVVVLVDVVHDLHLKEGLGGVVHDFVGQLGLGDVLPQLLDASASGLR